jgi:hypothetical protein
VEIESKPRVHLRGQQPSLDPDEILGPPFLHLRLNGPLNAPPQTNTLARLRETRFPSMTNLTNLKNLS